jgi:hypothetical protein
MANSIPDSAAAATAAAGGFAADISVVSNGRTLPPLKDDDVGSKPDTDTDIEAFLLAVAAVAVDSTDFADSER